MSALAIMNNNSENEILIRMAHLILEIINERGKCSIRDLQSKGFLIDDIIRHWPEACELAETAKLKPWHESNE